ncbi:xanthine dehydrogenase family protein molybdopterin-binding subunit [Roseiterribacter gracilis]|uniref:Aldehyde dehydrogenase n=1 Tax=Roseiterribacter gracilis TaxID=2812848 RepID=A0A8S8XAK0_9PROT|nr:aldehyde dehydrogenase [Rhodospirillales bacterium TMPK1]
MQLDDLTISRRNLLQGAAASGVLLAFHMPVRAATGPFAPNAFIRIAADNTTTLVMPQVEMGQGTYTSISMILAEELDADFAKVALEHAPPDDKLYANPPFGLQATGNSNSIRAFWTPLRTAGAAARAMLLQAAASQWKVDPATCSAANSMVTHAASGRTIAFGALINDAARLTPPEKPALKDPKNFTLIGKPLKRLDTPEKTNGKAVYGIDVLLPGMKFAAVAQCPVFGGKVAKVDDTATKKIAGVYKIVQLDDAVAVVADTTWTAKKGLAALDITWNEGANAKISSAEIWADLRAASQKDGLVAKHEGDAAKALAQGERIEAAYELPFLAHAPMEPLNCVLQLTKDKCEIWIGTQVMTRVQGTVAQLLNFPLDKVVVHNHLLGGGFGRRLEPDMALLSVRIAQKLDGELEGSPLKVIWSREEDIQHDVYRPVYRDTIAATLRDGKIDAWNYRVTGSSVLARWLPPVFEALKGVDFDAVDSAADMPYDIPNKHVEFTRAEPPAVPTGFWRGVGPNNNVFATECFIDELAKKAGKDPVAFRVSMLDKEPRLKAAVQMAAEKSGWGQALPARVGRGICAQVSFASFIATVVEAEVDEHGEVRLRRITSAVDTGIAVNPDTVIAQLQGGLIFGLTAALWGEITIERGRVQQSNFHDYRMLRIDEVPRIDVHVIKSGEAPGGIGETGANAGPPALRNAIYAATGVALRRLPIDRAALAGKRSA